MLWQTISRQPEAFWPVEITQVGTWCDHEWWYYTGEYDWRMVHSDESGESCLPSCLPFDPSIPSTITGWWFGCHFLFSHILGISSSQLTFIFFRGVGIQPPTRLFFHHSSAVTLSCVFSRQLWLPGILFPCHALLHPRIFSAWRVGYWE